MRALRAEGEGIHTLWRSIYALPPNDPRALDISEEEVVEDLLVRRFHNEHMRRLLDPKFAVEEEAATPEAASAADALAAAIAADPRIRGGIKPETTSMGPRPTRATVRSVVGKPVKP